MKKMIAVVTVMVATLLGLQASPLYAQEAPDELVRRVTQDVLSTMRADTRLQAGDTQRAGELISEKVLAHFNFRRMTALAVGRDWRQASDSQKEQLASEFRTLLVRTYANALVSYREQTVDFRPFRMKAGDSDALVRSLINQPTGQAIELDYWLSQSEGAWKVYDVVVAGVSLVTNYRDSFAREIRQSGIDGLIQSLASKNREISDAPTSVAKAAGKSS